MSVRLVFAMALALVVFNSCENTNLCACVERLSKAETPEDIHAINDECAGAIEGATFEEIEACQKSGTSDQE
jgi:hypothetical protein